jgi:Cys-tRNA(Pro) deacylase
VPPSTRHHFFSFNVLAALRAEWHTNNMKDEKFPITQAVRYLREHDLEFTVHLYNYIENGGTAVAAEQLGIEEHSVIKTIVLENELHKPVIALMHGDSQVSTKQLARLLGYKSTSPCDPKDVTKHTGYIVGGTSPFGTKTKIPIVMQESILTVPTAYINGGKRGFLVGVDPAQTQKILNARLADIAA